jgi:hypothetical protein
MFMKLEAKELQSKRTPARRQLSAIGFIICHLREKVV